MKTMKLPIFIHTYSVNDKYIAMFNAITLDVLYCKKKLISVENGHAKFDESILELLISRNMVVSTAEREKEIIDRNIQKCVEFREKNNVKFLYIVPTVHCNLSCTYCHIQYGKEQRKYVSMNENTLKNGLDIFESYGGFSEKNGEIMYYGGEPFLETEFLLKSLSIIRNYSETIKITIFTNGTLITEEIAQKLKKYHLYVIVSVDGQEFSHNAARVNKCGGGSFVEAVRGYRFLQEAGIDVGISLVAGTHNIDSLEEDVWYLAEKFQPLDIGISTLHLFPDMKNPNEVDIKKLTNKLQSVQKKMREQGMYIEHLFRKIRPFVEKNIRLYDCPSCNSKFLITPWNTIGFCEAFMEDGKYFYDMENFKLESCDGRSDWKMRVPLTKEECYSCPAISICGGGCPYDAYCESGDVRMKDNRRCQQSQDMIGWLCNDLFEILKKDESIVGQDIYEPSLEERRRLYGKVKLNDKIPLQNYSKTNEDLEN